MYCEWLMVMRIATDDNNDGDDACSDDCGKDDDYDNYSDSDDA